jgi:hypothetical protein
LGFQRFLGESGLKSVANSLLYNEFGTHSSLGNKAEARAKDFSAQVALFRRHYGLF